MRESIWLAWWEVKRSWPSYPWTMMVAVVGGLLATTVLVGRPEDYTDFNVDVFFVLVAAALGTNFGSRDCWIGVKQGFPDRLFFFRSLPVSATDVVTARALSRIPVLMINCVGFFLPPYVLAAATGSTVMGDPTVAAYIWFAVICAAYGYFWLVAQLYGELGLHGRSYNIVAFASLPVLIGLVVLLQVSGVQLVRTALRMAGTYGALAAVCALAVGVLASAPLVPLVARRVKRRDLLA